MTPISDGYALKPVQVTDIPHPDIPDQPPTPHHYRPQILVIRAGSNVAVHASTYREGRWQVAVIRNCPNSKDRRAIKNLRQKQQLQIFSCHLVQSQN